MVWLLRRLVRLAFTASAVGAVVWIAREAMRRWVDGPEAPQVAGSWKTDQGLGAGRAPAGGPGVRKGGAGPVATSDGAARGRAGGGGAAGGGAAASDQADAAAAAPAAASATEAPVAEKPGTPLPARKMSPTKAPAGSTPAPAKTGTPAPPAKKATAVKKAPPAQADPAKLATPAKKSTPRARKATQPSGPPAWVPPNGSGEAPATHPVKAKLLNRLYRVPGMPMYNRMVADRCYPDPESAESDGFKRAAR